MRVTVIVINFTNKQSNLPTWPLILMSLCQLSWNFCCHWLLHLDKNKLEQKSTNDHAKLYNKRCFRNRGSWSNHYVSQVVWTQPWSLSVDRVVLLWNYFTHQVGAMRHQTGTGFTLLMYLSSLKLCQLQLVFHSLFFFRTVTTKN